MMMTMAAVTLQHGKATQCTWLSTTSAGEHRANGTHDHHALTNQLDHFVAADQYI